MLQKNIKNKLEGYDKEQRHMKDNWERTNNYQEMKAKTIRAHM